MTLLFGNADMTFEIPATPGEPIIRAESVFVSVYKSAAATTNAWGNAIRRVQAMVRAQDPSNVEALWAAVDAAQRAPIVGRIPGRVFGRAGPHPGTRPRVSRSAHRHGGSFRLRGGREVRTPGVYVEDAGASPTTVKGTRTRPPPAGDERSKDTPAGPRIGRGKGATGGRTPRRH